MSRQEELNRNLIAAARFGRADMLAELVENGADVNARDEDGLTALHHAAWKGQLSVVEKLASLGANLNAQDRDKGWTAYHWAAEKGHEDVYWLLGRLGANPTIESRFGDTPVNWARKSGYRDIVDMDVKIRTIQLNRKKRLHRKPCPGP